MVHIGIDPGLKGSICVMDDSGVGFYKIEELKLVLTEYATHFYKVAIEMQNLRPNQAGMGKMMKNYGILLGLMQAFNSDYKEIQSKAWYKHFGIKANLSSDDRKRVTSSLMADRYPQIRSQLYGPRGGLLDGKSDALAIATYLKETLS